MLTLKIVNHSGQTLFTRTGEKDTYLALKTYSYQPGDKIVLETTQKEQFLWVQLDDALKESLLYLPEDTWEYPVLFSEELRRAYNPNLFNGERHYLTARTATAAEIAGYRNLALNPHDQKDDSGAYPHAYANVETRNDATFFARNAIDGMIANDNHGSYPYQSWGINQQQDAAITIDFGRSVVIDKIALVLRGDYPHDSYWTDVTLVFDHGEALQLNPAKVLERQFFTFKPRKTRTVTLKELIKHEDDSPFPALTEWEVFGSESKAVTGDF